MRYFSYGLTLISLVSFKRHPQSLPQGLVEVKEAGNKSYLIHTQQNRYFLTHKNQNYGNDGGPRKLDKTSSHGEREAESIRDKDLVNHLQRKKINIKEHETKEKVVESLDDKNFLYIPKENDESHDYFTSQEIEEVLRMANDMLGEKEFNVQKDLDNKTDDVKENLNDIKVDSVKFKILKREKTSHDSEMEETIQSDLLATTENDIDSKTETEDVSDSELESLIKQESEFNTATEFGTTKEYRSTMETMSETEITTKFSKIITTESDIAEVSVTTSIENEINDLATQDRSITPKNILINSEGTETREDKSTTLIDDITSTNKEIDKSESSLNKMSKEESIKDSTAVTEKLSEELETTTETEDIFNIDSNEDFGFSDESSGSAQDASENASEVESNTTEEIDFFFQSVEGSGEPTKENKTLAESEHNWSDVKHPSKKKKNQEETEREEDNTDSSVKLDGTTTIQGIDELFTEQNNDKEEEFFRTKEEISGDGEAFVEKHDGSGGDYNELYETLKNEIKWYDEYAEDYEDENSGSGENEEFHDFQHVQAVRSH